MLIEVTQEDINNGTPMNDTCCPIALACRRVFDSDDISVDCSGIALGCDIWSVPQEAEDFIGAFDENKKVGPFSFETELMFKDYDEDNYDEEDY